MIKDVPLTGIFVNDQEAALDFYTNKLGLEKVQDEPYGEGAVSEGAPRFYPHESIVAAVLVS
jgi:catechol 2,3-dioxygenase-like lactoylglutathione lyase family enzyme